MSGQFPSSIDIADLQLTSREKVLVSRTQSGKKQSRLIGGHLWEITVSLNLLSRTEFDIVWPFLMKQKGSHESFTIILPGHDVAQGAINGTPTYTSTTDDYTVVTGGWVISIVDQVKAGDVFNIAGDSKVYQATDDLDSDGSGNGNLIFYPALRKTPSGGAALTFNNVVFTVSFDDGFKPSYSREGPFYRVHDLKLLEAL